MANGKSNRIKDRIYPLISARERLLILKKVQGMWKNRKPDPIKELEKMRREWDRELPSLPEK